MIGSRDREAARRAQVAAVEATEQETAVALDAAMGVYLELVAAGVLGTGAGSQAGPPDLDAWPADGRWSDLVAAKVVPVLVAAWAAAYRRAWPGHEPDGKAQAAYAAGLASRLGSSAFPRYAKAQARSEVAASRAAGESPAGLRARLRALLDPKAPGKAARAALLAIAARAAAGKARPSDEKRRKKIAKRVAAGFGVWLTASRESAANVSNATVNAGTLSAADDYTRVGGAVLLKEWVAVEDFRTRPAHEHADGQTVGVDEPFTVDTEAMMYPGDPAGSAGNTANCRCSLLIFVGDVSEDEDGGAEAQGDDEMDEVGDVGLIAASGKGKKGKGRKGRSGRGKAARKAPRAGDGKKKIKVTAPPRAVPLREAVLPLPSVGPGWATPHAPESDQVKWYAIGE